ncbi:MAG TPA: S-formylglutathione hydrolase [Gammaproteobacteria bacterium]
MTDLELVSESKCFEGFQRVYRHDSASCRCPMQFAVYLPPAAERERVPALYWLSGLTCTEENFSVKSGAQRYAAELGLALIIPDTSPRGVNLPGEDERIDVGTGAGFYVNATAEPWSRHYRMYDYIASELVEVVNANLPVDPARKSISGHSMGGHGALVIGTRNADRYRSISAFAPISAPSRSEWGSRAFEAYLGADRDAWLEYDASAVIRTSPSRHELLVDQGGADPFLEQLRPNDLKEACAASGQKLTFRERPGYDHGYYFVATFIGEHLKFHAAALA